MSEKEDKLELAKKFSNYINMQFMEFQRKTLARGSRLPSQNEFIKWLGVEQTSYSNWANGYRPPNEANADILATKLGPEVYEILGYTPRLPSNKWMRIIAKRWHKLSERRQKYYAEMIENDTDEDLSAAPESSQTS